ncbi:hypothetical protein ACWGHM_15245 [Streptomyces sp. NPDC054904]
MHRGAGPHAVSDPGSGSDVEHHLDLYAAPDCHAGAGPGGGRALRAHWDVGPGFRVGSHRHGESDTEPHVRAGSDVLAVPESCSGSDVEPHVRRDAASDCHAGADPGPDGAVRARREPDPGAHRHGGSCTEPYVYSGPDDRSVSGVEPYRRAVPDVEAQRAPVGFRAVK